MLCQQKRLKINLEYPRSQLELLKMNVWGKLYDRRTKRLRVSHIQHGNEMLLPKHKRRQVCIPELPREDSA